MIYYYYLLFSTLAAISLAFVVFIFTFYLANIVFLLFFSKKISRISAIHGLWNIRVSSMVLCVCVTERERERDS
jgi:hypothetical protein